MNNMKKVLRLCILSTLFIVMVLITPIRIAFRTIALLHHRLAYNKKISSCQELFNDPLSINDKNLSEDEKNRLSCALRSLGAPQQLR